MLRCLPSKTIAILLTAVLFISSITVLAQLNDSNQTQNISVSQSLANESLQISNSSQDSIMAFSAQIREDIEYNISSQVSSPEELIHNNSSTYILNWTNLGEDSNNLEWQICLGGNSSDRANSIQQTADGGYIVAGSTTSNDGDVSGNNGSVDAWILKLNPSKAIQWQKCLGSDKRDYANNIRQTDDGGYIVAGYSEATSVSSNI